MKSGPSADAPVRVTVVGAAGEIGYALLPMIARGDMFGPQQRLALRCLDLPLAVKKEQLHGLEMELQDGNFPLVEELVVTCKDADGFHESEYVIILGAYPRDLDSLAETVEKNAQIFRSMGTSLQKHASATCKVLMVGKPSHVNALVCAHYAPKLPKTNFFALGRLEQNRAAGMVARRLNRPLHHIRNILVFGCRGTTPDLTHATAAGTPLTRLCDAPAHKDWLDRELGEALDKRGADILEARKKGCSLSMARAIVDQVRELHDGTPTGEWTCMGVWSQGNRFGADGNMFCTLPVTCKGRGRVNFASVSLSRQAQAMLEKAAKRRVEERDIALGIFANWQPKVK